MKIALKNQLLGATSQLPGVSSWPLAVASHGRSRTKKNCKAESK